MKILAITGEMGDPLAVCFIELVVAKEVCDCCAVLNKEMRLEGTLCNNLIISSVSLIRTCVKRDSTLKLTSISAGCN